MEPEIDGARAFYRHLNTCPGCQRPLYTTTEIAAMMGVSRRQFFRWLDGTGSPGLDAKIRKWLAANNPLPVRHG